MKVDKISILYVDDEPINLMLFEAMFNGNYQIKTFGTPIEALEFLRGNEEIKIVFSDMRMPKMNGVEFIREAIKLSPSSIYFVLTGFDVTKEIEEALNENIIKKYFQKPFNKKDLIEAIEKFATTE